MTQDEPWTIGKLLAWTADHFQRHGSPSPRLDAEILLAEARGCQRIELYTAYDEVPPESVLGPFRQLVRRRAAGEPVAYLVGRREFYSLSFEVTADVLIPRPETEFVVIALLDAVKSGGGGADRPLRIADVGTGSGILAVCAARHLPHCRVTAIDVSAAALAVARRNVARHGVQQQVALLEGDLLENCPRDEPFDFIISNPPYVSQAEWAELAAGVRNYEPQQALVAGPTGAEVIQRLVPQAAARLRSGGGLIVEISPMIEQRVREIIRASELFAEPAALQDLAGHSRVITARRR